MSDNLNLLADKLGIARHFSDAGMHKCEYDVSDDILKFFCKEYGYKADTDEDVEQSLCRFDNASWKKTLPVIIILRQTDMSFYAVLTATQLSQKITLSIQTGQELNFDATESAEQKEFNGKEYRKVKITLRDCLPYGYYNLQMKYRGGIAKAVLAVVPDKCYTTDAIESGKLWGYSLQLYALKNKHNWGVGDFGDLKTFVDMCAKSGADVIGLNPLNVLFHDYPENASPYSSVSRLFLNPIYIDVTAVPEFEKCDNDLLRAEIAKVKNTDLIDYTAVYNLKIKVLKNLFAILKQNAAFARQFADFKQEKATELDLFATFQALYSEQSKTVWGGWQAWSKELQNPASLAVAKFKAVHQEQIEFFKFLQFEADRQLKAVYDEVKKCGLKIGLYRDLPVGVCKDSAELWADKYVFMEKSGAGAPPDAFFTLGQKWCLGAFNPYELKNRAYEPYLKILRANMAYAGALRIDHVMGLMRLFMIPDDKQNGTYIYYNFDDMLGLLALESHLHKCAVVGESIGNVPDGFLDKLRAHNIYSISVLWSERWNGGYGDFKMSSDYPANVFVSVGTHDMQPLKMWWFGYDIELKRKLNMIDDNERIASYKLREGDRYKLLAALDFNQVWPQDKLRKADYLYGEGYPEGIEEAVHKLLAKTPCKVVMLQLEDVFEVAELQNLPGTDRETYPNWRHRLPINLEDMESSEAYWRNINAVKSAR